MKILFITEKYPPIVCAGNRVYNLVKELSKKHDITVFTRKNNRWLFPMPLDRTIPQISKVKKIYFKINDSLFLLPTMILFRLNLISNSKFYFRNGKKTINKNKNLFNEFDLVIASGPSWHSFYLAEYLFDKYNIPFILDYRDPWISKNKLETNIQRRIINKAKKVVTVTKSCVNIIKNINNYNQNISIIENGVDLSIYKNLRVNQNKNKLLKIGFAGRFVNYHNVDKLLFAISKLPLNIKKNIIFEGCGSLYKKYKLLAKKLQITSNFYGHLSIDKMNNVLNKCDLLYTGNSNNNAIGGKFYNYLALNKPILLHTFNNSTLDIEVNQNKLGFVSYNIKELSLIIKNIYLNKKLLDKNNFKIEKYIQNYDWKILAKKYNWVIKDFK